MAAIAVVGVCRGRVVGGNWIPITLVDGLPRHDPSGASARLVARLSREDFPQHYRIRASGMFVVPPVAKRPHTGSHSA